MYSFRYLEAVYCFNSSSNCCFLTSIQISQEADQVVWYSHLLKNFPQFVVIHIVKGFGVVNKTEVDVFLELSCCFDDPADVGNLISGSSAFSKSSLYIWKFSVHILLKPSLKDLEHYLASMWNLEHSLHLSSGGIDLNLFGGCHDCIKAWGWKPGLNLQWPRSSLYK